MEKTSETKFKKKKLKLHMSSVQTVVLCVVVTCTRAPTVSFLKKRMDNGTSVETFSAPYFEYKYYIDFPNTTLTEEDCSLTTSASISYCITQRNQFRKAFYTKVILLKLCYSHNAEFVRRKKKPCMFNLTEWSVKAPKCSCGNV